MGEINSTTSKKEPSDLILEYAKKNKLRSFTRTEMMKKFELSNTESYNALKWLVSINVLVREKKNSKICLYQYLPKEKRNAIVQEQFEKYKFNDITY